MCTRKAWWFCQSWNIVLMLVEQRCKKSVEIYSPREHPRHQHPEETIVQIQVYTGHHIKRSEALSQEASELVQDSLSQFSNHISRVVVHLTDVNSDKKDGNEDKRCTFEVRLEGRHPQAVTCQAATVNQVVHEACEKVKHLVTHTIERLEHEARHREDPPFTTETDHV